MQVANVMLPDKHLLGLWPARHLHERTCVHRMVPCMQVARTLFPSKHTLGLQRGRHPFLSRPMFEGLCHACREPISCFLASTSWGIGRVATWSSALWRCCRPELNGPSISTWHQPPDQLPAAPNACPVPPLSSPTQICAWRSSTGTHCSRLWQAAWCTSGSDILCLDLGLLKGCWKVHLALVTASWMLGVGHSPGVSMQWMACH